MAAPERQTLGVLIVHGTRKFLDRVGEPTAVSGDVAHHALGSWYATALFWRPQVALFVSEATLLPVLLPMAPAATVVARFPAALAEVLARHGVPTAFADPEIALMAEHRLAQTSNRSAVGIMNEFGRLSEAYRADEPAVDLVELSLWLARTPCGPLYQRHVSPDRELTALVAAHLP